MATEVGANVHDRPTLKLSGDSALVLEERRRSTERNQETATRRLPAVEEELMVVVDLSAIGNDAHGDAPAIETVAETHLDDGIDARRARVRAIALVTMLALLGLLTFAIHARDPGLAGVKRSLARALTVTAR